MTGILMKVVVAGIFGSMVGSFVNVLIYRLPRESLSVNRPRRSFCPVCGSAIPWHQNIPVLSYLLLGGKCRECGNGIALRYPLVEILTAVLFAGIVWINHPLFAAAELPLGVQIGLHLVHFYVLAVIVAVTFIDLEFQIIPDELTFTGMFLAPAACLAFPILQQTSFFYPADLNPHLAGLISSLVGSAVGGGTLYLVGAVGKRLLKREALGLGDVKYMIFVGGFVGAEGVLLVFFLGCALGSLVGLPLRALTGRQEIPFGPFLSAGFALLLFFRDALFGFLLVTWPEWVRSLL